MTTNEILNSLTKVFKTNINDNMPVIFNAIFVFIIGTLISNIIKNLIKKFLTKLNVDKSILTYSTYCAYIICLIITVVITLFTLGIPVSSIVALLGVLGVGFGIAFKTTLENLGSGFILLFFKPFTTGDYIESENIAGSVSSIHVFSTTLKTVDNKTVIIPNSHLLNEIIVNYTRQSKRRIDIKLNLPYETNIDVVKDLLEEIFKSEPTIIIDEESSSILGIRSFNNNCIEFLATSWVNTEDYWTTFYSLTSKIEKSFKENNINMYVPQKIIYAE